MIDKLTFIFVNYQPPSTNDAYIPTAGKIKMGNKRRSAYLRKSSWLQDWQDRVKETFDQGYFYTPDELREFSQSVLDNGHGLLFKLSVSMPRRSYGVSKLCKRDASNYIKAVEDALYMNMNIDDTRNVRVESSKYYNNYDKWVIKAEVYRVGSAWNNDYLIKDGDKYYEF